MGARVAIPDLAQKDDPHTKVDGGFSTTLIVYQNICVKSRRERKCASSALGA